MRAFIAIDLTPEIKSAVEALVRALRRKGGDVAWVKPEAMHLTIKFLGDISDEEAGAVTALLERIAAGRRPFLLKLKGMGTFPPGGRANARILWAGIAETSGLMEIQSSLEAECEKAGFPREDRDFHPHLTLGRVRSRDGLEPVLGELERNREIELGGMSVAALTFYKSLLSPSGPRYEVLARTELA